MFTTDSVSTISSGKIVAQTSTFEQTSMTDDDPGIRIIGDNKVELVYKNRITNEEASIDLYNSDNSSNNSKLYIDNPRGTTSLIIDRNRRLGIGNIVPEAIDGDKDATNEDGSIKPQAIDQSKLVPLLTSALQEAITKIETLEARVQALENE